MNARMRLLFFTNGLLWRTTGKTMFVSARLRGLARRRLDVLEQMKRHA